MFHVSLTFVPLSAHRNKKKVRVPCLLKPTLHSHDRSRCQRCDATRPICQRCAVARYQDECVYDAAPPGPLVEVTQPQVRRIVARRTSLLGDIAYEPRLAPAFSRNPPRPSIRSSITLTTPPQLEYPTSADEGVSLPPPSQSVRSASFSHAQPLQQHPDHSQPHAHSHQVHHVQQRPSDSSNNKNQAEPSAQTSVVLRTTTLVPSSPLLESTVANPHASGSVSRHYPIQADPTSPYYTFQDTRLIPNPIIRIYMANNANPRMFSLQNISPDTLSLLLSVSQVARSF